MKLTDEELQTLKFNREVFNALNSWVSVIGYLQKITEAEGSRYVEEVIKPRLHIKKTARVDLGKGEISVAE